MSIMTRLQGPESPEYWDLFGALQFASFGVGARADIMPEVSSRDFPFFSTDCFVNTNVSELYRSHQGPSSSTPKPKTAPTSGR